MRDEEIQLEVGFHLREKSSRSALHRLPGEEKFTGAVAPDRDAPEMRPLGYDCFGLLLPVRKFIRRFKQNCDTGIDHLF